MIALLTAATFAAIPVQLDGRWYNGGDAALIEYDARNRIFAFVDTLSLCRRANGATPTLNGFTLTVATGDGAFSSGIGQVILYRLTPSKHFVITSADGDIRCANQIATPFDAIFSDGFSGS